MLATAPAIDMANMVPLAQFQPFGVAGEEWAMWFPFSAPDDTSTLTSMVSAAKSRSHTGRRTQSGESAYLQKKTKTAKNRGM